MVRGAINHLNEIVNPESLDNDYVKGMARRDLKLAKCGQGFHVSGFLDQVPGAQFAAWLKAKSAPVNDGDDRAPADRRVDEFAHLLNTHTDTATDGGSAEGDSGKSAETPPGGDVDAGDESPAGAASTTGCATTRTRRSGDVAAASRC